MNYMQIYPKYEIIHSTEPITETSGNDETPQK